MGAIIGSCTLTAGQPQCQFTGRVIDRLVDNPRPGQATQLVGDPRTWRVRAGDWRILYEIADEQLLVLVLDIRLEHPRFVARPRALRQLPGRARVVSRAAGCLPAGNWASFRNNGGKESSYRRVALAAAAGQSSSIGYLRRLAEAVRRF